MSISNNKNTVKAQIQGAIAGINKHLSSSTSLPLGGTAMTPQALVQLLQSCLDAIATTASATAQFHAATAAEKQLVTQVRALLLNLKSYVENLYGKASPTLSDFGIVRAPTKPTVQVKAQAVDLQRQTRVKRGTMGKRQKAKLKASPVPATVPSTPAAKPSGAV
jgi:hypothetical protein